MSKSANAGELRTPVFFVQTKRDTDGEGYPVAKDINIFGDGASVLCKWVNAHGQRNVLGVATAAPRACNYNLPILTAYQRTSRCVQGRRFHTIRDYIYR